MQDSFSTCRNFKATFSLEPQINLEGSRQSCSAEPSLKNSGKKAIFRFAYFLESDAVKPIGTVDLMIIRPLKPIEDNDDTISSIEVVLKVFSL